MVERAERPRLQAERRTRLLGAAIIRLGIGPEGAAVRCAILAAAVGLIDPDPGELAVTDLEFAGGDVAARERGVLEIGHSLAGRLRHRAAVFEQIEVEPVMSGLRAGAREPIERPIVRVHLNLT